MFKLAYANYYIKSRLFMQGVFHFFLAYPIIFSHLATFSPVGYTVVVRLLGSYSGGISL